MLLPPNVLSTPKHMRAKPDPLKYFLSVLPDYSCIRCNYNLFYVTSVPFPKSITADDTLSMHSANGQAASKYLAILKKYLVAAILPMME